MPEWEVFLLIQWTFFLFSEFKCISPTVGEDLVGEQPVFLSCHKLVGLIGDWQLRILQVSVKLFIGCTWAMKLCQLVWYFRTAAIAGHQQMGLLSKIHLVWSLKFNRVSCVPSLYSWWRENDIYRLFFSPWHKNLQSDSLAATISIN